MEYFVVTDNDETDTGYNKWQRGGKRKMFSRCISELTVYCRD